MDPKRVRAGGRPRGPELHPDNLRLWVAWKRDLTILKRSPSTIQTYFYSIQNLDRYFGSKRDLSSLTRLDLKDWIAATQEAYSPRTVKTYVIGVTEFYRWLVSEEEIPKSPVASINLPEFKPSHKEVVPESDRQALLATCTNRKKFTDVRDRAIIELAFQVGGPRRAEIVRLELDDYDETNEILRLHGKGGKVRFIPVSAQTGQALFRYLRLRRRHRYADSPTMFLGTQGPLNKTSINRIFGERSKRAGIKHTTPHQGRHFAADEAMRSDMADRNIMTLFGWSSQRMLDHYAGANRTSRAIEEARTKVLVVGR